jgi:hypothetical protein
MQSHDGEGAARTIAIGESIAEGSRLGSDFCLTDLRLALTFIDYARLAREEIVTVRAIKAGEMAVAAVNNLLPRLKLTPRETGEIVALLTAVEAGLAALRDPP